MRDGDDDDEVLEDATQPDAAAAAEKGRAIVAEARAVRRRMLDDAQHRRRALVDELERMRASIDDAIAALTAPDAAAAGTAGDPGPPVRAPDVSSPAPSAPATPAPESPRSAPTDASPREPARVGALFDVLRSAPPVPKAKPRPRRDPPPEPGPDDAPTDSGAAGAEKEPETGPAESAPADQPGDAVRRRRDALVEPLVPDVVRASKRLLQDEQNSLLDTVRRARGRLDSDRLLPEPARQRETWTALLAPSIDAAYLGGRAAAGKSGRVTSAPDRLLAELAALLVMPLRERVSTTIEGAIAMGPYDDAIELQRELGSAIGARFREWRGSDLETHVVDVLAAAYSRGAYDGAGPAAMLQWVPADPGRCPDCDDNALEPTLKGKAFPTGQPHPPAHPGCRCIVVPADAGESTTAI